MKASDFNLQNALSFHPEHGHVLFDDNRMLLFRVEALATLRKLLGEQLGDRLTRGILSQFGYRCGTEDHKTLSKAYDWDSEVDELASGPVIHTWEGIVRADPTKIEFDRDTGHFHMQGTWTNSYEADIHLAEFGQSDEPVCHTLTGYASGWCSSFFGRPLLAIEPTCRGRGDDVCRFEIKPLDAWGSEAESFKQVLSDTSYSLTRELEAKLVTIERQAAAIRELSTPVMEIWDDVLVLPIVGVVDTKRSMEIMDNLLQRIVDTQSRCVIIDVTGVEVVDTKTADYLLKVVRASNLLGTRCVLTGLSPAIAQTLVEIGADLAEVRTLRNLKAGLKDCLRFLRGSRSGAGEG
jgi:rsbT co-antagonist protein RsbR